MRGATAIQIAQYEGSGTGTREGWQEVTLAFTHPVVNLSFDILNFHYQLSGGLGSARRWWQFFIDSYAPGAAASTVTYNTTLGPGALTGSGTTASNFKRDNPTATSGDPTYANLGVVITGPVTSLKLHFNAMGYSSFTPSGWPTANWPMCIANLKFCRTA